MEDAQETGLMMTLDTFKQAVKFGTYIGNSHFVLSGGEPTENEHITEMCEWMELATGCNFSIVSNGMWLKDERKRQRIEWISRLRCYLGMQVYTSRQWYKEYDYVASHKHEYEKYNKVIVDADAHIFMQDLGRARSNSDAQREVEQKYHKHIRERHVRRPSHTHPGGLFCRSTFCQRVLIGQREQRSQHKVCKSCQNCAGYAKARYFSDPVPKLTSDRDICAVCSVHHDNAADHSAPCRSCKSPGWHFCP